MRFVSPDGSFWEVSLTGKTVHARWGRAESVKTRTAPFKTIALAKAELEQLVKKVKKLGYRLEGKPAGVAEALRANPDDDSPLVVHGDELVAEGDLRGELATLVTRGLTKELGRFLQANATALFGAAEGDVHEGSAGDLVWAPGFVRQVTISTADTTDAAELIAVTRRFLSAPVAEFIRELNFGLSYDSWSLAARQVTRAKHPELVNALRFDAFDHEAIVFEDVDAGDFDELWPRLPELRELKIAAGAMDPGELVLPELRFFSRIGGGFTAREVRAITTARWPKLDRLELGFARESGDEVSALLSWLGRAPALAHLALRGVELSEDQVELLLDSEALPRLRTLDLSDVLVDEDAAERLRDGAEALAHLKRFSSPSLFDEEGDPTMPVFEDELDNLVVDAFAS